MRKGQSPRYFKEYRRDRLRGIDRSNRDATPIRELFEQLARDQTLLQPAIAARFGISRNLVWEIMNGRKTVRPATYDKIMSGRVDTLPDGVLLPAIGSKRRLQGLQWLGHRECDIDPVLARHGSGATCSRLLSPGRTWLQRRTVLAVNATYDELWRRPGPSSRTAKRAAAKGWVSPLAWNDDTIDDPTALPMLDAPAPPRLELAPEEFVDWVREQLRQHASVAEMLEDLGIERDSLLTRLRRHEAYDLLDKILGRRPSSERIAS